MAQTVQLLVDAGLTYEKDGALWLRATPTLAQTRTRSCAARTGFYTYYAVDIAYHRNKFIERGFDRVIGVWGAGSPRPRHPLPRPCARPRWDSRATSSTSSSCRWCALCAVTGSSRSKRTGKALSPADLMDEIGVDACRFFFNAKPDSSEFDLDLAIRQDSEKPRLLRQYAHARICTLLWPLWRRPAALLPAAADVALLTTPQERELIKQLAMLPEEIQSRRARLRSQPYQPLRDGRLAARFHRFYNVCRIKDAEPAVRDARLMLADATRRVLEIGLGIIGVTAPEKNVISIFDAQPSPPHTRGGAFLRF